uniref:Novel protein similar to MHC class II antigen alpha chain n=1 Tax=Xenopus tropicalis TaxID=8364 RepID=Q28J60_XENTR|nr:Novel protein similar to MHC class II antigen alpha chain [Xenopus tropicalis]
MLLLCALLALALKPSEAATVDCFDYGAEFYQTRRPTGEYLFDYNGNEMFHVDLESKSVVWTLPGLEKTASFDPQAALQDISVMKFSLDVFK